MRESVATFGLTIAFYAGPFALNAAVPRDGQQCQLVAGEKYLGAEAASALCREVERAIAAEAPGARYSAEIRALSPTRLAAMLTVNGRKLPEHKFAVMDASLSPGPMQRFARSLATDVANAVKK